MQLADLNPIELVWDELDRKVRAKQDTSMAHLSQLLQESWTELFSVYLSLVEWLPRNCEAVIAAKRIHFDESKGYEIFLCFFNLICIFDKAQEDLCLA